MQANTLEKQTMKKTFLLVTILFAISLVAFSFIRKTTPSEEMDKEKFVKTDSLSGFISHDHAKEVASLTSELFQNTSLISAGLPKKTLELSLQGYLNLIGQGDFKKTDLLSIVDLSQSSRKKRFYLIDVKQSKLLVNTYVSHAKNSGADIATDFSNVIGSEKSSLGFYLTKQTYTGKNGLSLRMEGLEKGFNDNAEARSIVVHGADYVNAGRVNSAYMGRSQGCPALPRADYTKTIDLIKNGSVFFIYSENENYLKSSQIINS